MSPLRAVVGAFAFWVTGATAAPFEFAVTGDTPYNPDERVLVERMLQQWQTEPLSFAVHIGDIKSGHGSCRDATYADRHALLDASPIPLVLLPGDNDWTDCDRFMAGGYDPEERLAKLRRTFFADDQSLGRRRLTLERQSDQFDICCVENRRWWHDGVPFVTLHVVGSANNRGNGDEPRSEYVVRDAATVAWLLDGFAAASQRAAPAIVLFIHADPELLRANFRPVYATFLQTLETAAKDFGKPVLLVHGDTHRYVLDHPWARRGVPNLLRLETFGSPTVGWVRVRVDPDSTAVFWIEPGKPH
ncbi:MAG: hypothetical protein KIT73_17065 [Burkholderiales bacterium]|nr:hypothetical protein [Burkholderiales bacterium]